MEAYPKKVIKFPFERVLQIVFLPQIRTNKKEIKLCLNFFKAASTFTKPEIHSIFSFEKGFPSSNLTLSYLWSIISKFYSKKN